MTTLIKIFTLVLLFNSFLSAFSHQLESTVTKLIDSMNFISYNQSFNFDGKKLQNVDFCGTNYSYRKLSNGKAAKNCQFPFVAELKVKFESGRKGICTGSLVSPKWILTAKHCLFNIDDPIVSVTAIMGSSNQKDKTNQQIRSVENIVRLKDLVLPDIALGELKDNFHLNKFVNLIKLPEVKMKYTSGVEFVGVGWGKINSSNYPEVLQYAWFKIHDIEDCQKDVGIWSQFAFCSKGINKDSSILSGDSGGPAVIYDSKNQPIIIGINVATKADINGKIIWQLTTMIEPYLSWIQEHINHL